MNGMIYTFYSYKGGVGRSMALANLGMYFYKQGYTTLLVDWDLEAPGLERYFEQRYKLNLIEIAERPGLVNMIEKYMETVSQPASEDKKSPYPPLEDYLYTIDTEENCRFLLLHSGRRGQGKLWQEYANFVQNFDWAEFYDEWEGGVYLEWLREQFKTIADIVMIDSRTGVTEMGGVTTQHLADVVLLFCGANIENIENTARMARNFTGDIVKHARNNRALDIMVVPSRIDDADSEGYGEFLDRLKQVFDSLTMRILDDGYSMAETLVPYLPAFSYKETLVIDDVNLERKATRLLEAYRRIAANIQNLASENSVLKRMSDNRLNSPKLSVFISYAHQDKQKISVITDYLTKLGVQIRDLPEKLETLSDITREIKFSDCVLVFMGEATVNSRTVDRTILVAEDLNKPIIPILIENTPIPFQLVNRLYIDFSNQKTQPYDILLRSIQSFKKSIRDTDQDINVTNRLVYLSYSTKDREIVARIQDYLEKRGYKLWIDRNEIQAGEDWVNVTQQALSDSVVMIAIISSSYNQSKIARNELSYMVMQNKPVIPVRVDHTQMPLMLLSTQYIDLNRDTDAGLNDLDLVLSRILQKMQN